MAKRKRRAGVKRLTKGRLAVVLLALAALVLSGLFQDILMPGRFAVQMEEGELCQLLVFDVGQGSAALVRTHSKTVLIDGGEREAGRGLLRGLRASGVRRLDWVVASHPHADHIGGLPQVLDGLSAGGVILGELPERLTPTTAAAEELLDRAERLGADLIPMGRAQTYDLGEGVVMTVLNPASGGTSDLNNASLLVRVDAGEVALLLMGDAEQEAEDLLLRGGFPLQADILVAGHHGSNTSSGIPLVNAVRPAASAISAGRDNPYGHPHALVLSRLAAFGPVCRTDLEGTVAFSTDGQTLRIQTAAGDERLPERRDAA